MFAGFLGALSALRMTLSGSLSTAGPGNPVTSATRTVSGNGTIRFSDVFTDASTPEFQKNGGTWTTMAEGATVAVVSTDTIAVRASIPIAGVATFTLFNNGTGARIQDVTLSRTS